MYLEQAQQQLKESMSEHYREMQEASAARDTREIARQETILNELGAGLARSHEQGVSQISSAVESVRQAVGTQVEEVRSDCGERLTEMGERMSRIEAQVSRNNERSSIDAGASEQR